jgi:hypothetical protein
MYPKDLDIPIPDINVLNERINSPEYQGLLMPLAGSHMTRGTEQQWPMLVSLCDGLGANTEKTLP